MKAVFLRRLFCLEGEWVMAADTYSLQALVLRKTKLGETDLIVTLLAQDGRQVRAVAKGARKPNSSFASRLEIFWKSTCCSYAAKASTL